MEGKVRSLGGRHLTSSDSPGVESRTATSRCAGKHTTWVLDIPSRCSKVSVTSTGFFVIMSSGPCRQLPMWKNLSARQHNLVVPAPLSACHDAIQPVTLQLKPSSRFDLKWLTLISSLASLISSTMELGNSSSQSRKSWLATSCQASYVGNSKHKFCKFARP